MKLSVYPHATTILRIHGVTTYSSLYLHGVKKATFHYLCRITKEANDNDQENNGKITHAVKIRIGKEVSKFL